MRVKDAASVEQVVDDPAELGAKFSQSYEGYESLCNEFWLCHEDEFPAIHISVRSDKAVLHYFTAEGAELYQSRAKGIKTRHGPEIVFFVDGERYQAPACSVIALSDALRVAWEFFQSKSKPKSIHWARQ